MKLLLSPAVFSALVSVSSLAYWFAAPVPQSPPQVTPPVRPGVYLSETQKHVGEVGVNGEIRDYFTVINDSDRTVILGEPMKSCSCTVADIERRELAPGERCRLDFAIRTGTRRGPRAESIVLMYATPDGGTQQLAARVLFVVKGAFDLDPVELELTRDRPKATFTVRGNDRAGNHKVLAVRSEHPCVKVDASALPTVAVELDLESPDESILNTECLIQTDHPSEDAIRLPIRVRK